MLNRRRFLRILVLVLVALLVAGTVSVTTPAASAADSNAHLDPGGHVKLPETVPVNVVFVGYEPDNLNVAAFRGATGRPTLTCSSTTARPVPAC